MKYLHNFLPTKLPPASHAVGFKLWFDEMIKMWLHSTGGNIYCGRRRRRTEDKARRRRRKRKKRKKKQNRKKIRKK